MTVPTCRRRGEPPASRPQILVGGVITGSRGISLSERRRSRATHQADARDAEHSLPPGEHGVRPRGVGGPLLAERLRENLLLLCPGGKARRCVRRAGGVGPQGLMQACCGPGAAPGRCAGGSTARRRPSARGRRSRRPGRRRSRGRGGSTTRLGGESRVESRGRASEVSAERTRNGGAPIDLQVRGCKGQVAAAILRRTDRMPHEAVRARLDERWGRHEAVVCGACGSGGSGNGRGLSLRCACRRFSASRGRRRGRRRRGGQRAEVVGGPGVERRCRKDQAEAEVRHAAGDGHAGEDGEPVEERDEGDESGEGGEGARGGALGVGAAGREGAVAELAGEGASEEKEEVGEEERDGARPEGRLRRRGGGSNDGLG